jgi:putative nucleotidyltransferase with HDIG domain
MQTENRLLEKLRSTRELPTIPAVLVPLLQYLDQPLESVDMHKVMHMVSQDKSLAARCLQVANSPLFGSSHEVESIQSAVVSLGILRVQEIAVSCSLLKLLPGISLNVSPSVFWAHSLGCALVAREFASKIGYPDPAKAYTAGLLHDVGVVALLWVAPHDFRRAVEVARAERIPLHEAEAKTLGITHVDTGKIIAENWHLPAELVTVIAHHHSPEKATSTRALVSIVTLSDLLCRVSGMGYGHSEDRLTNFADEPAFAVLREQYSALQPFDFARFTFEMEGLLEEVQSVVAQVYGIAQ